MHIVVEGLYFTRKIQWNASLPLHALVSHSCIIHQFFAPAAVQIGE
ncbi:unnamed protein product, partial [Ilex paraguariensis]